MSSHCYVAKKGKKSYPPNAKLQWKLINPSQIRSRVVGTFTTLCLFMETLYYTWTHNNDPRDKLYISNSPTEITFFFFSSSNKNAQIVSFLV